MHALVAHGMPDDPDHRLLKWPLAGNVVFIAAYDTRDNFAFLVGAEAGELGITKEEVREHAISNFRTMAMRVKSRTDCSKPLVLIDRIGG